MIKKILGFSMIMFHATLIWSAKEDNLTLALNWKPEPQFGGFYAAQINNHFKNQSLHIKILEGGSGTPTVQMLANKKVDFAIVSAEEILISNDRNSEKIVAVFATYQVNPQMIMCHEQRGFKTLQDVFKNPGTLAWQNGLTYALYLSKKMSPSRVNKVPYSGGISTFLIDNHYCQQGFSTSEALLAENAGKKPKVFLIAEEGFNPYTTVVAVRREDLQKNKQKIVAFVKAIKSGWNDYVSSPEKINIELNKLNKAMDLKMLKQSAKAQNDLIVRTGYGLGQMTLERWEQLGSQLLDLKVIKNKPDYKTTFENL